MNRIINQHYRKHLAEKHYNYDKKWWAKLFTLEFQGKKDNYFVKHYFSVHVWYSLVLCCYGCLFFIISGCHELAEPWALASHTQS